MSVTTMFLLLLSSAFFLSAQGAYPRYPENVYEYLQQHSGSSPFQGYGRIYSRALSEEHYDEAYSYFGEYPLTPNQSLFVKAIQHVAPKALIDHAYQRVMAQASNPNEFYYSVIRDPEAVEKETPEIVKFVQDYVQGVEQKMGKAQDPVDDPKNFFNIIAPKLFMAVKALQVDGLLQDYLKRIGLPDYMFSRFYLMVLENPQRLYTEDGKHEIEQELHLQPGTVQKLKQYFYEDTTIYNTFRRYMENYVGPEENKEQERVQEISQMLKYAEYIQNVLAEHKVTFHDVLHEYQKVIENPQLLHSDGVASLGPSPAAKALEVILKEIQQAYSGVAAEETAQQVLIQ